MDAMEALLGRVSATTLTEPSPDDQALNQILGAAMRAPDHGRMRPWRFLLVRNRARQRLGKLFADALLRRNGSATEPQLQSERAKAGRAPLIIVVSASIRDNPKVPPIEQIVATGAAAQNMMLAAHALGFGAMWRTGPNAYDSELKQALGLSREDVLIGFLYIGTPASRPPVRETGDFTAFVREFDSA